MNFIPQHTSTHSTQASSVGSLVKSVFFGNYFYGICAVALSVEATLQQRFPLNGILYFVFVFVATVLYYTKAYIITDSVDTTNQRTLWYAKYHVNIRYRQMIFALYVLFFLVLFIYHYWFALLEAGPLQWFLILVFPAVSALYYGINLRLFGKYSLRSIGWLKPFIIGFAWAGLATVYPILFYNISHGLGYVPSLVGLFLFIKNFMFVTVLCIMFDIKDYATDHNHQLKTFVVNAGLRKTIFYIIIPLCVIGLGSFMYYGISHHFHLVKILLNTIPFILLIVVAYSLHRRKPILYYLIIIDGLMLVKAICGSVAMIYF